MIAWVYSYIQICCRLLETKNEVGSLAWSTVKWTGMKTLKKKKWIKCKQSHFARVTRTQPCTAQTLAIQQILHKWLSPGYLMYSLKPTWIAFPVNDITVDENAWTLVHRANLSVAHPWRERTPELFRARSLSPLSPPTIPATWHGRETRVTVESSRLSPETTASNPVVFSKQDEGAMECTQVQILVEQLSYGKIFGPSRAGILLLKQHAPLC